MCLRRSQRRRTGHGCRRRGLAVVATGFPYDFTVGGSNSLWCSSSNSFYACPDIPVQIAPLQRANPRTAARLNGLPIWYANTGSSFQEEPIGQFGNTTRNEYHGPGINNTNLVLAKNFNLSADGARRLQLRMESDNVFNHTQFSNPTGALSQTFNTLTGSFSGSPGTISSAAAARQTLLAAKFYF